MTSRQRVYRTEAVVLRRMDLGEADRLLTLYTPDEGKIRAIAKGVRRPGSRKSGHLEPFSRSRLLLARGRNLDIITQAEGIHFYPGLRTDLERLGATAYIIELLDRFTVQEGGSRGLYELLLGALDQLEAGAELAPLCRYYELRLLDLVGYRPQLFHCVACEDEIQAQDQYFSSGQGGVLCPNCGRGHREAQPISLAALKVLRHFQRSGYAEAVAPHVRDSVHTELEQLTEAYLTYLLERKLNAPRFMRRVRGLRRPSLKSDVRA